MLPAPSSPGSTTPSGGNCGCRTIGRSKGRSINNQPAHRRAADLRDRLVSQDVHAARRRPRAGTSRIEFDGAMSNSRVWLNGHELGGRPYGYIGFALRSDAVLAFRRADERAGGAADAGGPLVALVSRRGHLSQRVARCHRAGARGALGNVRHHARGRRTPKATVAVKTELRNQVERSRRTITLATYDSGRSGQGGEPARRTGHGRRRLRTQTLAAR